MPQNNVWLDFLSDRPRAAFNAFVPEGQSPFARYARGQYTDVWDQYEGRLGKQILQQSAPSLNFVDFMGQYDFGNEWMALSPYSRGERASRFSPRTVWNV